jgi:D-alanyl-D-alanine carboxypeptidase
VGSGRRESFTKIVFVDPRKRRRLWLAAGAVILLGILGLAFWLPGPERRGVASANSSEPQAEPSRSSAAWTLKDLMLRYRAQEPPKPPDPAPTCGDLRVLVDRSHTLPPHYAPEDLVSLPAYGVPTVGGREMTLRREAAEHLRNLVGAGTAAGEELVVASAFRSYEDQRYTYGRLKSIYGAGADAMSAAPGHSQHQLGTAVDFTNATAAYQVLPVFGRTGAALWLQNHATEYGFVLAYPPGKDTTGYDFEPWHYRYIGVENAGHLERSGLTLQEFLVRKGVLPDC